MSVDQDRYNRLISSASFNAEFFRGTIADLSSAKRPMSFVGAPTWGRVNGLPCLKQSANGDRAASVAIASVVDTTTPFWVEAVFVPTASLTYTWFLMNQTNAGGWELYCDTSLRVFLMTRTAALGNARYGYIQLGTAHAGRFVDVVMWLDPIGLTARAWVNGIPFVTTFANTAPPVLCAATALTACGVGGLIGRSMLARIWQGTPSNADAQCLAAQSELLVGGWS